VLFHDGPVEEWETGIEGARKIGEGLYEMEIGPESYGDIKVKVESQEPARMAVSLHAGVSIPLGNFNTGYNPGINLAADFEYSIIPRLSVAGIFGFNYFFADSSVLDDIFIMTVAAALRYHQHFNNKISLFLGTGPELFIIQDTGAKFGLLGEAGLDFRLSRLITLELGARYHGIFDIDYQFITADFGVLFRF
jgi:hypothetical protein